MANELIMDNGRVIDYAKMETSGDYIYYCYVAPNANASLLTQCSIMRVKTDGTEKYWANGLKYGFTNTWANRLALTYSEPTDQ